MKKFGLTMRQLRVLNFIRDRLMISEVPPSFQEICEGCDIKSKGSNVHRIVHTLHERGYVNFIPGRARSLMIVDSLPNRSVSHETQSPDPAESANVPPPS